MVMVKMNRLTY